MDGRILLYAPDQTLSDGGEQRDSLGFLDQHNLPAWDTWLYYIPFESAECNKDRGWPQHGGFLVSWVPGELVELINHAMRVNYDYCFVWEDELSGVMPRQPRLFG